MECSSPVTVYTTGSDTLERCVVNESADCDEAISLQGWSGQLSNIGFFSPAPFLDPWFFPIPCLWQFLVPLAMSLQKPLVLSWAVDPNWYQLRGSGWNSCICRRRRPFCYETPPLCRWSSKAKLSENKRSPVFLKRKMGWLAAGKWRKGWVDYFFDKFLYFCHDKQYCMFLQTNISEGTAGTYDAGTVG